MSWTVIKRDISQASDLEYELVSTHVTKLEALAAVGRADLGPEYELALVSDESRLDPDQYYKPAKHREFTEQELRLLNSLSTDDFALYFDTPERLANVVLAWKQQVKSLEVDAFYRLV